MQTNELDGLVLVDIMSTRGRKCGRNTKIETQIKMDFIMWLMCMFIESKTGSIMWWVLLTRCCFIKDSLWGFVEVSWHPENAKGSQHWRRRLRSS